MRLPYDIWENKINAWETATDLEAVKHGPVAVLKLTGKKNEILHWKLDKN